MMIVDNKDNFNRPIQHLIIMRTSLLKREQKQLKKHTIFFKQFIGNRNIPSTPYLFKCSTEGLIHKNTSQASHNNSKILHKQSLSDEKKMEIQYKLKKCNTSYEKQVLYKQPSFANRELKVTKLKKQVLRLLSGDKNSKDQFRQEYKLEQESKFNVLNRKFREKRDLSIKKLKETAHRFPSHEKYGNSFDYFQNITETVARSINPLQPKNKSLSSQNHSIQVTQSCQIINSNLLNPDSTIKHPHIDKKSDSARRFFNQSRRIKSNNLLEQHNVSLLSEIQSDLISKQVPQQLAVHKILLPKRNYRHQFLQNLQKIKENHLKIKGNSQKKAFFAPFREILRQNSKISKTYQIKYNTKRVKQQQFLLRSKTQIIQNRKQWQQLFNIPLEPWQTHQQKQYF